TCRRADSIIRDGLRRPGDLAYYIRLFGSDSPYPRCQPARPCERFHGDAVRQILSGQRLLNSGSQVFFSPRQHPRRNIFAADLEQQLGAPLFRLLLLRLHARTPDSFAPPICSRYACAVRQATARTRAISAARSVVEITPLASSRLKRCEHFKQWSYAASKG